MTNTEVAIFDVDDTLVNTSATRDGVARPIDEKMVAMLAAEPIVESCEQALMIAAQGIKIALVTARGEAYAEATKAQIEAFGIPVEAVYARRAGDNRVDWKVKTEALANLLADGFVPVAAFDDKPRNLDVFAEHGIPTTLV